MALPMPQRDPSRSDARFRRAAKRLRLGLSSTFRPGGARQGATHSARSARLAAAGECLRVPDAPPAFETLADSGRRPMAAERAVDLPPQPHADRAAE